MADDGYLDIVGTALQVNLEFVWVDERPPPLRRPLGGHDAVLLRTVIEAQLPEDKRAAMQEALSGNLDAIFGRVWRAGKSQIADGMRSAAPHGAIVTSILIPDEGRLRARTSDNVSQELLQLLSPVRDARQLTFSYVVTGLEIGWTEEILDFPLKATFDGEVRLDLGLPHDPRESIAATAQFLTSNEEVQGGDLSGSIAFTGAIEWQNLWGDPITIPGVAPDELSLDQLGGLRDRLMTLSQAFSQATEFGFNRLSAFVDTVVDENLLPSERHVVTLVLTHPFEPGPAVSQAGGDDTGPFIPFERISLESTQVNPGGYVHVTGDGFPLPSANQLTVQWTDTAAGHVVQSELQWGMPPMLGGPPLSTTTVKMDRDGGYDNHNTWTTDAPLSPETTYTFRVRDYTFKNLIATDWSAWTPVTTSNWDHVDLMLEDGHDTNVGSCQVYPGGGIGTAIHVPDTQPPGRYRVWALLGLQRIASTADLLEVLPPAQPPAPQIRAYNHITHDAMDTPGTSVALTAHPVDIEGVNFRQGTVALYLDNETGLPLGTFQVYAGGTFEAVVTVPHGQTGRRVILAKQDDLSAATIPIEFENPPA